MRTSFQRVRVSRIQKNLDSVINKAEEILDEYPDDEFDDLVLWVYDKYNQQQAAEAAK